MVFWVKTEQSWIRVMDFLYALQKKDFISSSGTKLFWMQCKLSLYSYE